MSRLSKNFLTTSCRLSQPQQPPLAPINRPLSLKTHDATPAIASLPVHSTADAVAQIVSVKVTLVVQPDAVRFALGHVIDLARAWELERSPPRPRRLGKKPLTTDQVSLEGNQIARIGIVSKPVVIVETPERFQVDLVKGLAHAIWRKRRDLMDDVRHGSYSLCWLP